MSMGSLRTANNYQTHGSLSAAGRPDMTNSSQQMMYSASSLSQRMDINNSNKLTTTATTAASNSNLSAYYGNQPMYNNSNNNNGFPPLPSPSSMTSSPNTPMLSPVRQSFSSQQQSRHYSMSSSSSGSIPRYNTGRNSFDMMSSHLTTTADMNNGSRPSSSVHPHMIPEVNLYDQRLKDNNSINLNDTASQGFSSSPNIGQLLNPVHPLNTNSVKSESMDSNTQFFQSMGISNTTSTNYSDYSTTGNNAPTSTNSSNNSRPSSFDESRLPSISNNDIQQQQQQQPQQFNFSYADEYTQLLTELHEVYCKDQPHDVLQYCANFFNRKLEEQRSSYFREQHGLGKIKLKLISSILF